MNEGFNFNNLINIIVLSLGLLCVRELLVLKLCVSSQVSHPLSDDDDDDDGDAFEVESSYPLLPLSSSSG